MEQLAIGADFEGAAARWNEGERRDPIAEIENLSRQTDGFRCVVSNAAILDPDFDFHRSLLSAPEISGKGGRVKCRRFALRSAGSILLRRAGPRRPEGHVYNPARLVRPRPRWRRACGRWRRARACAGGGTSESLPRTHPLRCTRSHAPGSSLRALPIECLCRHPGCACW